MPKVGTPERGKRKPTEPRTPRSAKKGDELGKNKTQQTLFKYFSSSPMKWESSATNLNNKHSVNNVRKTLFPNQSVNLSDSDAVSVCISDDDERTQKSIESYHPKWKKPANFLSRKYAKIRQGSKETLPASNPSNGNLTTATMNGLVSFSTENLNNESTMVAPGTAKSTALRGTNAAKPQNGRSKGSSAKKSRKRKITHESDKPRKIVARNDGNSQSRNVVAGDPEDPILVLGSSEEISSPSLPVESLVSVGSNNTCAVSADIDSDEDDSSNIFIRTSLDLRRKTPALKTVDAKELPKLGTDGKTGSMSAKRASSFPDTTASQSGAGKVKNQPIKVQMPASTNQNQPADITLPKIEERCSQISKLYSESEPKKPLKLVTDGKACSMSAKKALSFSNTTASRLGPGKIKVQPIKDQMPASTNQNPTTDNPLPIIITEQCSQVSKLHSEPDTPLDIIELSSESIPVSSLVPEVGTPNADDQLASAEDWSLPMEQEIFHSPVKILPQLENAKMEQVTFPTKLLAGNTISLSSSKVSLSISRTPQKVKTPSSQNTNSPVKETPLIPHNCQTVSPPKQTPSKLLRSPSKSPKKGSPSKSRSPKKYDLAEMSGNVLIEHSINECKRYAQMAFKMNATNRKVADDYLILDLPEKILLHHLLVRKWSWIREVDMKYDKVVHHKANSLTSLETKGFLECMSASEDLKVILDELKLPELVELCKLQNLDKKGTKKDLADRLNKFASRQGGLGFTMKNLKSVMKDRAVKSLGRCWKVAEGPRVALQQIFEASMCPVYLEGQFYTFQERLRGMELLMNEVKFNGKKLVPFSLSEEQLFTSPTQFDEYVSSVITKYDILSAGVKRDHAEGTRLATEILQNLKIYLGSTALHEFLQRTPRHLWRYTACANYSSALDKGIEFLKRSKNYKTALEACDVLLQQDIFRRHARGHWYAEKILLMDKHLKSSPEEIFVVLLNGLEEELTAIGRLELSKKAEGILNKKKNGLSPIQKQQVQKLICVPKLNHPVREIKATEAPNVSAGTRQTFVELTAEGEQIYSNVEQTARNAYMDEFPEGLHDEGAFLKNIILAAFWPVIYMPKENVFLSRYQHCPLDWGTPAFYKARHGPIKDLMAKLRSGGLDGIMILITETISTYNNFHSIVNWFYVTFDMLPTIRNLLACLTVDKFLLLAEYLLENYRERRSGWPDLTLWNFCTGRFLLVEVKSPNDELSFKQIVWLEKFAEMGIAVEECRVNATNKGKKRRARALANAQTIENC